MKPFFYFPSWLYRLIPTFLIVVGVILNIYALKNWVSPDEPNAFPNSTPTPTPSLIISEPRNLQIPTSISNSDTQNFSKEAPSKFGHLPYIDENFEDLIIIASYGQNQYQRFERLMPDAALALMKMIYAARDDGVWIVPASAFRDYEKQEKLFNRQIQAKGSSSEAAKSVAPPGYSEHHTGYAVDLVDGNVPDADINSNFANTQAFQWLIQNAGKFGYELSFPLDNRQGVKYEPWHWRFVNSSKAAEIFERAKNIF